MKKHHCILPAVIAAFAAAPAFADEAPAGAPAPAAPAAVPAAPASPKPAVLPRVMPHGPKFESLSPEEKEHVRKMAEFRAARDEAERDVLRLRREIEARRAEILEENEEAKSLFEDAEKLLADYVTKTNALQTILEKDERIAALFEEMEPAKTIVEANQFALNREVAAAMQKRMAKQREAAAAAGTFKPPQIVSNVSVRVVSAVDTASGEPLDPESKKVRDLISSIKAAAAAGGIEGVAPPPPAEPAAPAPAASSTSDEQ